jgi:hypothetical protein
MKKEIKKQKSEFGKGFVYNLILFAKHWWNIFEIIESYKKSGMPVERAYDMWFYGASDHFYEFEIPEQFKDKEIGKIAEWLKEKCLYLGHGFKEKATEKDFEEVFKKLEKLALLIDKELGIEPVEATFN